MDWVIGSGPEVVVLVVGHGRNRTFVSPATVSLIRFLVSTSVLSPELKIIYPADSGIVLPLYLLKI